MSHAGQKTMNGRLRARQSGTEHIVDSDVLMTNHSSDGDISLAGGKEGEPGSDEASSNSNSSSKYEVRSAIASAVLPEWLNVLAMLGLIFGGCCSNVFALEAIVKEVPASGTLITCFQFVLTTLFTLPSHLDVSRGARHLWLKERGIPFRKWVIYTAFFVTINLLNNKAFDYKISVPLHIILRSAGPVATMVVHRIAGRRFEVRRVLAVLMLFVGVVLAAIADAQARSSDVQLASLPGRSSQEFWTGFGILGLALVLSAALGVFSDRTYAEYGRDHTEENLFYSHAMSMPFILARWGELRGQMTELIVSPSTATFVADQTSAGFPGLVTAVMQKVPIQVVFLVMNGLTQYLCIRGVNQLSAHSSSLTVSIVLNIRKLVSLLLSIWLFGNRLAPGVLMGAALVFLGGALYAIPSRKPAVQNKEGEIQSKKEL